MTQIANYGSWKSPIISDLIVSATIGLSGIYLDSNDIYWIESRPSEGGRNVIVRRTSDGKITDITPSPFNVRTRVHEYGGSSFIVTNSTIYFANFTDQRLYHQTIDSPPQPLTPAGNWRYADSIFDRPRHRLICIREDHTTDGEPINTIVSINLDNGEDIQILTQGNDFYASPRLSPDNSQLSWLTWNHPNMPWDGTELWVADIKTDGSLGEKQLIAGGINESIFQPEWSPDGQLYFISDRTNWWNIYRIEPPFSKGAGEIEPICEMPAEFGLPQWVFGMSTYAFTSNNTIICTYTQNGTWHLANLNPQTQELTEIHTPYTDISGIKAKNNNIVFLAGSPTGFTAIVQLDLTTNQPTILKRSSELTIDSGYLSNPQPIEFPTENGQTAHAFFYPPKNRDYIAPNNQKPPLIVKSHGGPTTATSSTFNLKIQYWTSRGFAVIDVNYGGSTGYGRAYRQRLKNNWGIVDVDDCTNAAKYLAEKGLVDSEKMAIAGGSAGGYTTLCALTFRNTFKAGASYYGISDLVALATDTHKFESRYLDGLIGPYPERADLYKQRSPIHFTELLSCPIIFFQGLEDKVVLPNQAEMMVAAIKAKGLPVAYIAFAEEQHGFRRAENIKKTLDGEIYFYSKVFGFELADAIEALPIANLDNS
ncbi:peptidase [Oscillatoriales cyanobacterium USR001]|nr:peptidase [Oscillatoriales cyanobacterium USR001]